MGRGNLIHMKQLAKKSLGQHFLISEPVLDRIVAAAGITKEDTIFEIGPGTGNLTKKLLDSPAREIIAVEKDDKLYKYLGELFSSKVCHPERSRRVSKLPNRLKLIHGDALTLIPNLVVGDCPRDSGTVPCMDKHFKVVANLPYNIASPAIISLLTVCPTLPEMMVVMLQREVAERIVAKPGNSNRGLLTVFLELFGEAKIVERVNKGCFRPIPEVDSAVVRIVIARPPAGWPWQSRQRIDFAKSALRILKAAFSAKRKKIKNSLFTSWLVPGQGSSHPTNLPARSCCITAGGRIKRNYESTNKIPPVIARRPKAEAAISPGATVYRHFTPQEALKIAQKCGFSLDQRPEELTRDQWLKLISSIG